MALTILTPLLFMLLAATGLPLAAAVGGWPADDVRAAIDAGNARWIEAFAKADPQILASCFASDGAVCASDGAIIVGRENIAARMGRLMEKAGPTGMEIETIEVWIEEGTAFETGRYTYHFIEELGGDSSGKYLVIWKRQADGSWKIYRDFGIPD